MLNQHWTLEVSDSRWLGKLRIICAAFFVLCALGLWVVTAGFLTLSGWWGDWLWPWPMLLYLTWLVAMRPAPLLDTSNQLQLSERGKLGADFICHSLATPWLLALQLAPQQICISTQQGTVSGKRWVWVVRDQLSPANWTRLNRVCRSITLQSAKLDPDV